VRVSRRADLAALPRSARETRDAALHVVADIRREGIDLATAARQQGLDPGVVRAWTGDAYRHDADRLARRIVVIGRDGPTEVVVRGSRAATVAGEHANAVRRYLETGNAAVLSRFRGRRVGGVQLETRPAALLRLAREGRLDVEYLYAEIAG
jgi:hypothetical protein